MFYLVSFPLIYIIALLYSLSSHVYHCFMEFSFISCVSLFNDEFYYYSLICSFFSYTSLFCEIFFLSTSISILSNSISLNDYPLFLAIFERNIEIVKLLVEHGADVNKNCILFHLISFIILWNFHSCNINNCFILFFFSPYQPLFYRILFIAI